MSQHQVVSGASARVLPELTLITKSGTTKMLDSLSLRNAEMTDSGALRHSERWNSESVSKDKQGYRI
jgi:hypothetical protein